ncbi:MAG: hypothetical protein JST19_19510 [Bacteroidetes bacterium]|nr:hypothetical protein [Bacteroidota bacterium]
MTKWFVYIVLLLVLIPWISFAGIDPHRPYHTITRFDSLTEAIADTTTNKNKQPRDSKIKEVAKAKRLPKPEKIDENNGSGSDKKKKRERRPPGLERPPEIPRHNGG